MQLHITTIGIAVGIAFGAVASAEPEPGGKSRQQVVAEMDQARASDSLHAFHGEDSGAFHLARIAPAGSLARTEVQDQVRAARSSGELNALTGEDSGSSYQAQAWARGAASTYAGPSGGDASPALLRVTHKAQ